jgi:hypothetical protein
MIAIAFAMGYWHIGLALTGLIGFEMWKFINEHEGLRIYPNL